MKNGKIKVLIISGQYPPTVGGGGTHAYYLANELISNKKVNVTVLTSHIKGLPKDEKNSKGLEIYRVDFKHSESLIYEAAIAKGLEICEKKSPDIIHCQHIDGTIIGLHLKASFNIPLIVTLHKTPLLRFDDSIPKRVPLYSNIKLLTKFNGIDYFVAGSKIFNQELQQIGLTVDKIKFIYHGVPYKYLQFLAFNNDLISQIKLELNLKTSDFLIICPSRLDERKELDALLKAIIILQKDITHLNFKVIITGDVRDGNESDKKIKNQLIEIAKSSNFQDNLIFKKFAFEHLPSIFSIADVCILPSKKEGLGLVLLEALSVRCPVIAANAQGIDEVIQSEINGLLFEPSDTNDLYRQLKRLILNPQLKIDFKKNGLKKVKETFNAKRMADEHIELYHKVLNINN
ncbi:MAG: hypothetical protein A2046_00465 [Bacteroidetes bacterium GWA2_30_7]|nr:MAG: hypothetical protein A2046_00465 [Bacteroidetes bacterium GWA2_30_7]